MLTNNQPARHYLKCESASRDLLSDCEIFANLRLTFVSSFTSHTAKQLSVSRQNVAAAARIPPRPRRPHNPIRFQFLMIYTDVASTARMTRAVADKLCRRKAGRYSRVADIFMIYDL